jgi:hypothetical protein
VDKPFDRNAALRAREAERRPMVKLLDLPATKGQADLKKFVQFQVGSVFIDNFMDQRLLPFRMRISQRQVRFTHLQPILSRACVACVVHGRSRKSSQNTKCGGKRRKLRNDTPERAACEHDQSCDGLRAFLASLVPRAQNISRRRLSVYLSDDYLWNVIT